MYLRPLVWESKRGKWAVGNVAEADTYAAGGPGKRSSRVGASVRQSVLGLERLGFTEL
jgi:hypothetical protein